MVIPRPLTQREPKMTKARVNIRSLVNSKSIRHEKRNGRDVIVVPSATLPDDVVMNGIRYPAKAIAESFATLEGTPAPLGHPMMNGEFVSASDPRGIVVGFIGAWNENVRQEGGRVLLDKVIDVEYASQLEGGKRVLNAIEEGKPIHTSTGLYCNLVKSANAEDDTEYEADGIVFDHDAILLDEAGAATPSQGVGMLVNQSQGGVVVVNSILDEAERELDWAVEYAARAVEKVARVPLLERIKEALIKAVTADGSETQTNQEEEQSMNDAQFEKLSGQLNEAVATGLSKVTESFAEALANALKPVTEMVAAQNAAAEAAAVAKKADLVNKVTEAGLLTKEVAEAADSSVLEALVANSAKGTPKPAYRLNSNMPNQTKAVTFDLPDAE